MMNQLREQREVRIETTAAKLATLAQSQLIMRGRFQPGNKAFTLLILTKDEEGWLRVDFTANLPTGGKRWLTKPRIGDMLRVELSRPEERDVDVELQLLDSLDPNELFYRAAGPMETDGRPVTFVKLCRGDSYPMIVHLDCELPLNHYQALRLTHILFGMLYQMKAPPTLLNRLEAFLYQHNGALTEMFAL